MTRIYMLYLLIRRRYIQNCDFGFKRNCQRGGTIVYGTPLHTQDAYTKYNSQHILRKEDFTTNIQVIVCLHFLHFSSTAGDETVVSVFVSHDLSSHTRQN
jgi:hypothetical protein